MTNDEKIKLLLAKAFDLDLSFMIDSANLGTLAKLSNFLIELDEEDVNKLIFNEEALSHVIPIIDQNLRDIRFDLSEFFEPSETSNFIYHDFVAGDGFTEHEMLLTLRLLELDQFLEFPRGNELEESNLPTVRDVCEFYKNVPITANIDDFLRPVEQVASTNVSSYRSHIFNELTFRNYFPTDRYSNLNIFKGILKFSFPPTSGVSSRGTWKRQELLFEINQFSSGRVVVTLLDQNLDVHLKEGAEYYVIFKVIRREFNDKWFTEIRVVRIDDEHRCLYVAHRYSHYFSDKPNYW